MQQRLPGMGRNMQAYIILVGFAIRLYDLRCIRR